MRMAIIGTGNVGQSLAKAFLRGKHEIRFGSRQPANVKAPGASAASGRSTPAA